MNFQFKCKTGCTKCCEGKGRIYLLPVDILRAASLLGITTQQFHDTYVFHDEPTPYLKGTCPFLEPTGCKIHEAKPWQCFTAPFWPENVKSIEAWNRAAEHCPGMTQIERSN